MTPVMCFERINKVSQQTCSNREDGPKSSAAYLTYLTDSRRGRGQHEAVYSTGRGCQTGAQDIQEIAAVAPRTTLGLAMRSWHSHCYQDA